MFENLKGEEMKIGIIADSHDHREYIIKSVECFNDENVEMVIHAGDIVSPFTEKEFKKLKSKMKAVFGNNDGERFGLKKFFDINLPPIELTLDNKKIIVMHEPHNIEALKESNHYDVIIYGHSHDSFIEKEKTTVINPGETCCWLTGKATVVILDTESMETRLIEL